MQRLDRKLIVAAALAGLAPLVGACTGFELPSMPTINTPRPETFFQGNLLSFSGQREDFSLRPAAPHELVGPDGQCAYAPTDANADPAAAPGQVQGGIALQMTECDVVRRAGMPEQVELGRNERGERSAVLTYLRGARPGIYRFASGRLYSIERGPEPPAPARQQKSAPKKRAQTTPN